MCIISFNAMRMVLSINNYLLNNKKILKKNYFNKSKYAMLQINYNKISIYIKCTVKKANGTRRIAFHGSANFPRRLWAGGREIRRNELFLAYRELTLRYCEPLWLLNCVYRISSWIHSKQSPSKRNQ